MAMDEAERRIGKLEFLVTMLLVRTGVAPADVPRAFEMAEREHERTIEEVSQQVLAKWRETPEGKEAARRADEVWRERQQELWREDCIEDGRIYPDPTRREE